MNTDQTIEYVRAEEHIYPFKVWNLTLLDQSCYPMVIRGTWIFNEKLDVKNMRTGLTRLLTYYPHLCGRMKDKYSVHLTNDGVSFTEVDESNISIKDVDNIKNPIKHFSTEIKPSRIKKGIDPPMSIKITMLKDGCVLGVQCSHMCMDGDSFYTMVYNWTQICKKEDFLKPVLDQSLFLTPEKLSKDQVKIAAQKQGYKKIPTLSFIKFLPKLMLGILNQRSNAFHISSESLKTLKQKTSTDNNVTYSTNTALSAFITHMCIKLFSHDEKTICKQVTVANTRMHLENIPSNFVGNASTFITTPSFFAGASMDEIAKIIHQTIEPIRKKPSPELKKLMTMTVNLMSNKLPMFPFDFTKMHAKKPTVIHINNFSKLHIYDIDFGLGKPLSVIPHDLGDQVLIWPAHPDKGGVEVYFSGTLASMIHKLKEEDPWLLEMKQYA